MEDVQVGDERKSTIKVPITWSGHEYVHFDKTAEWFWALGLIAISGAVTSLVFGNLLFAVFILIAGFVLALFAARRPSEVTFSITQRGVKVDEKLYPFQSLDSFGIDEFTPNHTPKLVLRSKHTFVPHLIIPLNGVSVDEVHDFLISFLPEDDHAEPLTHRIMEWLGF